MLKLKCLGRGSVLRSRKRRTHVSNVASVDVHGSSDQEQTELDTVPLPRPLLDSSSSEAQSSSQYTSLDDLPSAEATERTSTSSQGFSLDKTQSLWLLNIVSFVYGTNTTMIKDTIENSHLAPSILCALRYGMAAGLMLPFLLKPGLRKVNWGLSFELGLTLFVAYQCQARELVTESASEGSIMLAVYLLLVPLVELVFGRPFTSKKLASLLVAVGGVALLAAGGGSEAAAEATTNTIFGLREGTVWGLLSAVSFALHLVRSEIRQHEAKDVGQLAAAQLIVCGLLSVGLLAWTGSHDPLLSPQLSPAVIASQMPWGPFLITLLFGTVIGQSGELVAVAKVPASTASLTLSLVVVWGLFCGALVNHDRLAPLSWAGAALIVGATIIPKILDVLADRNGDGVDKDAELVAPPPTAITSEEFVRTTVSASMLAATPVLSEAGLLGSSTASATSTAASVVTRQVLGAAAEASLTSSGLLGTSTGAAAVGGEAAISAGANALASAAAETGGAVSTAVRAASSAAKSSGAAAAGGSAAKTAAAAAASAAAGSAAVSGSAASGSAVGAAAGAASGAAVAAASGSSVAASGAGASTAAAASAASTAAASTAATTAAAASTAAASGAAAGTAGTSLAAAAAGSAAAAAGGAALVAAGASGGDVSSVISGAADVLSSSSSAVIDAANAAGPAIESLASTVVDVVTSTDPSGLADLDPTLLIEGHLNASKEVMDISIFDAQDAAKEAARVAEESVYGPGQGSAR